MGEPKQTFLDFSQPPPAPPDEGEEDAICCSDCGVELDVSEIDDCGEEGLCMECSDAWVAAELLADIREGCDLTDMRFRFFWADSETVGTNDVTQLIYEASNAARRGDLDQSEHLLRLAAEPKWGSEEDCQAAYDQAMADKRQMVTA